LGEEGGKKEGKKEGGGEDGRNKEQKNENKPQCCLNSNPFESCRFFSEPDPAVNVALYCLQ
jgi:hypothetical protein